MKKNNIVVLINLDKPQLNIVQNSINVAKSMNAAVTFLYVKKAVDVVQNENHLSAIKTLTDAHMKIDGKMRELLEPFQQSTDTELRSKIAIGNVKNHIAKHLNKLNPDLVILGKRSKKILPWEGDRLTQFVVNEFNGPVLISATDQVLELNEQLSLGLLSASGSDAPKGIVEDLLKISSQPVKSFKIVNKASDAQTSSTMPFKTVEYAFEPGDNAVKNLSKYVHRNNVNLLFLDRDNVTQRNRKASSTNLHGVINQLPSSLLLA
ncbi:MAG: universal stress protein [Bacteroidia bacterium]|nr:universal stress protein [Bacteroidia bacterium]MBT8275374.1 universal stress protein [Bacteroidia bacterium]NNF31960.1 universal stress protein [Flavobacteriaceae bacterium]NNK54338.1 universal stress protein [Flavobacteriaceae bacterium]NNM09714.1 universal stress protein [Flavobacteriaceae bacterium]